MSSTERPPAYSAYLLRCWLEGTNWRYSLEAVGSGKRHGFATLDELVSFLVARSNLRKEGEKEPNVEGVNAEAES